MGLLPIEDVWTSIGEDMMRASLLVLASSSPYSTTVAISGIYS